MRILIFSDSHGEISLCTSVITKIGADMIIHAGDHATDAERLSSIFSEIPVKYVKGNCDFSSAPSELDIALAENKKIYVTHGLFLRLIKLKYIEQIHIYIIVVIIGTILMSIIMKRIYIIIVSLFKKVYKKSHQ